MKGRNLPKTGEETDEDFFHSLTREDNLGAVIKATIHIENQLIKLIEENVSNKKHIKDLDLDFFRYISLALTLGLDERFRPPLRALATIRNRFAHKVDATLGDDDVKNLYRVFAPEEKKIILSSYQKTRQKLGTKMPSRMGDLDARYQFSLYATTLRSALKAARNQSNNAKNHG